MNSYTNTQEALRITREDQFQPRNGDRPEVPNFVVVITDGASNIEPENTIPNAEALMRDGATIISIGVTDKINLNELRGMASQKIENTGYFRSQSFRVLDVIQSSVSGELTGQCGGTGENQIMK